MDKLDHTWNEITDQRIEVFLETLQETGSVTAAARAATPWSKHRTGGLSGFRRRRANDPEFAARWDEAEERALGKIEAEISRRAMTPTERPVVSNGQVVAKELRYDNRLLLRYAAALAPERWSERQQMKLDGQLNHSAIDEKKVHAIFEILTKDERAALKGALEVQERIMQIGAERLAGRPADMSPTIGSPGPRSSGTRELPSRIEN